MDKKEKVKNTKEEAKKVVKETKGEKNKKDTNLEKNENIKEKKNKTTRKVEKAKNNSNEKKVSILGKDNNKNSDDIEVNESEKTEARATNLIKAEDIEIDEKKLNKINEEIKENKKNSRNNEIKKEKYMRILRNVVIAVMGIAYISINLMGAKRIPQQQYQTDLKVFIIISVISAILLFEKAFKSNRFRFALLGIELLVLGGATIILLHLYNLQSPNILKYSKYFILIWFVYYVIKSIIIATKRVDLDKKEVENN